MSVSLLSIFDVFHCQLYIKVGLDPESILIMPSNARTPVIAARSYVIIIIFTFDISVPLTSELIATPLPCNITEYKTLAICHVIFIL